MDYRTFLKEKKPNAKGILALSRYKANYWILYGKQGTDWSYSGMRKMEGIAQDRIHLLSVSVTNHSGTSCKAYVPHTRPHQRLLLFQLSLIVHRLLFHILFPTFSSDKHSSRVFHCYRTYTPGITWNVIAKKSSLNAFAT